jgi:hypothetical protein
MVSHQIRDCGPKVQPIEGKLNLMSEWDGSHSQTNPLNGRMENSDNANGRAVRPQ